MDLFMQLKTHQTSKNGQPHESKKIQKHAYISYQKI